MAIGGGALGDTAGFLAATYLRGIPVIHVPTTLVAQIDSSIGGKTAVDLPEGKNLVGAFHQPAAIVIDVAVLRTLPERQRRAALGEAVKMAALGDERLFELLERDGRGDRPRGCRRLRPRRRGRARRAQRLGQGGGRARRRARARRRRRPDHAQPRPFAGTRGRGRRGLWRPAARRGRRLRPARGLPDRAGRRRDPAGTRRADRPPAGRPGPGSRLPSPTPSTTSWTTSATDKKHRGGRLRWVLPTATGVEVRSDIDDGGRARRRQPRCSPRGGAA